MKNLLELFGIGGKIIEARVDLKRAKIEAEADAVRKGLDNEGAWEMHAAQNAANSWLDEWWTLVLSVPLVMCFVNLCRGCLQLNTARILCYQLWYIIIK